jgi:hypothetical protein
MTATVALAGNGPAVERSEELGVMAASLIINWLASQVFLVMRGGWLTRSGGRHTLFLNWPANQK